LSRAREDCEAGRRRPFSEASRRLNLSRRQRLRGRDDGPRCLSRHRLLPPPCWTYGMVAGDVTPIERSAFIGCPGDVPRPRHSPGGHGPESVRELKNASNGGCSTEADLPKEQAYLLRTYRHRRPLLRPSLLAPCLFPGPMARRESPTSSNQVRPSRVSTWDDSSIGRLGAVSFRQRENSGSRARQQNWFQRFRRSSENAVLKPLLYSDDHPSGRQHCYTTRRFTAACIRDLGTTTSAYATTPCWQVDTRFLDEGGCFNGLKETLPNSLGRSIASHCAVDSGHMKENGRLPRGPDAKAGELGVLPRFTSRLRVWGELIFQLRPRFPREEIPSQRLFQESQACIPCPGKGLRRPEGNFRTPFFTQVGAPMKSWFAEQARRIIETGGKILKRLECVTGRRSKSNVWPKLNWLTGFGTR